MKKNKLNLLFWAGMLIVIGSHLYMLGFGLPENQMIPHAVINLVAAGLLLGGWCKRS